MKKVDIELYRNRLKHTIKEHKYERYATYILITMLIIVSLGVIFKAEIITFYILIPLIITATIMRLNAGYHHYREKKLYRIIK